MSDERKDQQLDEAYRRASAADAGRPDAKLRAAILAEAAAASRRRQPAANESRYALRAVAGVAVVGLALLVWQQARHEVPRESVVADQVLDVPSPRAMPSEAEEALPRAADVPPAAGPPAVGESPSLPVAPREPVARAPESTAPVEEGFAPPREQVRAQAPPPAPQAQREARNRGTPADGDSDELSEVQVSGTRVTGRRTPPGPAISETQAMELLRRHFPRQYQSGQAHRLWLVLDAAGRSFASGELQGTEQLQDIEAQVGLLAGAPDPWQVHGLVNARGQVIELAIAHSRQ